jgi:hypothetical protein
MILITRGCVLLKDQGKILIYFLLFNNWPENKLSYVRYTEFKIGLASKLLVVWAASEYNTCRSKIEHLTIKMSVS